MLKNLLTTAFLLFQLNSYAEDNILDAEAAMKNGAPLSDYSHFAGHPLYPYLQYREYRNNLETTPNQTIVKFLRENAHAPFAGWLAEHAFPLWLSNRAYNDIVQAYSPAFADESIECEWRLALLHSGKRQQAEANIESLWMSSKNIDPACDPLFIQMLGDGSLSQKLIADRFQKAMQNNNLVLAARLQAMLKGNEANSASNWLAVRQNTLPAQTLFNLTPAHWRTTAIADSIYHNAKNNREQAINLATALSAKEYAAEPEAAGRALSQLAALLAQDNDPRSEQIFALIPQGGHDKNAVFDLLAYEMRLNRWQAIPALFNHMSEEDLATPEYQYWIGKAYEKTGQPAQAKMHYQKAAGHRDFFGFLAAEKLGLPYAFNDKPLTKNPKIYHRIKTLPEIYRIKTFLRLGDKSRAAQEYNAMTRKMTDEELRQAALLAAENGWTIQSITTLSKTKDWDALAVRFPVLYQNQVRSLATRYGISPAKIYAIIRKESIFQPEIKSRAGAIGLMQVMPATARHTAKKYGIPYTNSLQLTIPETNLNIGSQYLADRLNQFGHLAYAAAAYNAGPSRANRWLADNPALPLDEWIAQIPFYETRDYAKRVLEYEKIYEYRLGLSPIPYKNAAIRPW
ncbi:transglycosylase SLT domain-containing protein [Suttonella ornithocola]|uniref:Soluble lytic murein transglycosylase n=1 Tax=Suttonella ornithocola TaxID=279832 RepID=A0A380MNR7_9GAMM|nr:transglycosylase SLT domain-containing protein [Suttonella ornithocola]SUO93824.1 Soluble lytic murein transglycosylase precursor [Suttonella ornithocola]